LTLYRHRILSGYINHTWWASGTSVWSKCISLL